MLNNLKIKLIIKKARVFLSKIPPLIVSHAFAVSLLLLLISLVIGFFLFYNCTVSISKIDFEETEHIISLDNEKYENVLKNRKEDQEKFDLIEFKIYLNPFNSVR
jgi:hypothetical protein